LTLAQARVSCLARLSVVFRVFGSPAKRPPRRAS
jgi:hypothetical protein